VHPLSLPGKCVTIEAPAGLAAWDYVEEARAQGHNIPNGSSRCGVREIQTDDGIWTRVSSNKQAHSVFEFKSWDDLEAEEAAEVSVEVAPEVEVTEPNVDESPTFRNEAMSDVYAELDSLLGKVASVHTLSIRLSVQEQKVRTTLSKLKQRDLVARVEGAPNVWEIVR